MARSAAERHQRRDEPARPLVHHREHHLEAGDARAVGFDADRLGRHDLPERRAKARSWRCGRVDRNKGTVRWKRPLGGGNRRMMKQQMSSPSPVTDGRTVWVMTGTGVLKAFDFDGKERWARDIQKDYGRFGLQWGYASSPLLHEDSLYVQVLHGMHTDDPSYLLRIDKATARRVWRVERPTRARFESPDAYTTPALLRHAGGTEIVITGGDVVTGHDLAIGQGTVARRRPEPEQRRQLPHRRLARRARRPALRAVARAAAAGASGRAAAATSRESHVLWSFDRRSRRADAGHRRHLPLLDQRSRHHVLPRREDRQDGLRAAAAAQRHLQRLARAGRRQDLHHRRRRRDQRRAGRVRSSRCWPRTISWTTRSARRRSPTGRSSSAPTAFLYAIGQRRQ